mmetsp:Transcript_12935/g.35232  ORF Transcript_12935/g.35232 Transcript_12935/m.35232 type:complete len:201 (-) Transcript_12935:445-1047(-)
MSCNCNHDVLCVCHGLLSPQGHTLKHRVHTQGTCQQHRGGEGQHLGPIPKQHINVGPAAAVMAGPPLVHKGMPLALGRNLVVHMERIMVEVQPIQSLWTGTRTQQRGKINVVLGVMAVVAVPAAAAVGGAPLLLPIAHLQLGVARAEPHALAVLLRQQPLLVHEFVAGQLRALCVTIFATAGGGCSTSRGLCDRLHHLVS